MSLAVRCEGQVPLVVAPGAPWEGGFYEGTVPVSSSGVRWLSSAFASCAVLCCALGRLR
jgi:hypothetical protein